jgi:hypothetical protein
MPRGGPAGGGAGIDRASPGPEIDQGPTYRAPMVLSAAPAPMANELMAELMA